MRRSVLPTRVVTMGVWRQPSYSRAPPPFTLRAAASGRKPGRATSPTTAPTASSYPKPYSLGKVRPCSQDGRAWIPGATVDGPAGCSNKSFQAAPGTLDVRQDLIAWDTAFYRSYPCNSGPWITNAGWSHEVSTGYGWLSGYQPPCGNTWYYQDAASYWLTGGVWHGSWHSTGWLYVWSTF